MEKIMKVLNSKLALLCKPKSFTYDVHDNDVKKNDLI